MLSYATYTPSAPTLFTVEEMTVYLHIPADTTETDDLVSNHIDEAQRWAENATSRLIGVCAASQTWYFDDGLPYDGNTRDGHWFSLKYGMVVSVQTIEAYKDGWQTLWAGAGDLVDGVTTERVLGGPARIRVKGIDVYTRLRINYTCGHVAGADIPLEVKHGIRRMIWHYYNPSSDGAGDTAAFNMVKRRIIGRYGR